MKLFLVTIKLRSFYVGCENLSKLGLQYPNANKIELVSEKVVFNQSHRYDLLKEAYDFIKNGANTHSNEFRVKLESRIENHLNKCN